MLGFEFLHFRATVSENCFPFFAFLKRVFPQKQYVSPHPYIILQRAWGDNKLTENIDVKMILLLWVADLTQSSTWQTLKSDPVILFKQLWGLLKRGCKRLWIVTVWCRMSWCSHHTAFSFREKIWHASHKYREEWCRKENGQGAHYILLQIRVKIITLTLKPQSF